MYSKAQLNAGNTFQYVPALNGTELNETTERRTHVNTLRLWKIQLKSLFWTD